MITKILRKFLYPTEISLFSDFMGEKSMILYDGI